VKAAAWLSIGVALVLLATVGMFVGPDPREVGDTSFGTRPSGHGALFALLRESGYEIERSYAPADALPDDATVWWIAPDDLCPLLPEREPEARDHERAAADLRAWIERGGTALLALPSGSLSCALAFAGLAVPARRDEPADDEDDEEPPAGAAPFRQVVQGPLPSVRRTLETAPLLRFETALGWEIAATLDDEPFILTRELRAGRVVVVADAGFLQNHALDRADAALLAHDLLVAYGVPFFDERSHGLRATEGTLHYLARSSALPFLIAAALLAALALWNARALPPRSLPVESTGSPSLGAFVGSLASLYAGTRDHGRVFERYREFSEARVRRALHLPVTTPREQLYARLRAAGATGARASQGLRDETPVRGRAELQRRVGALDHAVDEFLA